MKDEITHEYIKGMLDLYRTKSCNEFTDEEIDKLEKIMCDALEGDDEA